jgi:hypothetical protein
MRWVSGLEEVEMEANRRTTISVLGAPKHEPVLGR